MFSYSENSTFFQCRKYPPKILVLDNHPYTYFPELKFDDYCFEFVSKKDALSPIDDRDWETKDRDWETRIRVIV